MYICTRGKWNNLDLLQKQKHGELGLNNLQSRHCQTITTLVLGVELLHVPIPLHLRLIPVDTTFHLAREGQEMPVNELGSKAVASMLLGSLDVVVDKVLRLEPLITALIGARERTLTSVIHQMELELCI